MSARKPIFILTLVSSMVLALPAIAEGNGNGRGNSNGHGGESHASSNDHENRGNGSINRELGGLNASHASENAREHANGNSAVGFIANLKKLVDEACAAPSNNDLVVELQNLLANPPPRDSAEISGLMEQRSMEIMPTDPTTDAIWQALYAEYETVVGWESRVGFLQGYLADNPGGSTEPGCSSPADVIRGLLGDRELSDEAMAELLTRLGY